MGFGFVPQCLSFARNMGWSPFRFGDAAVALRVEGAGFADERRTLRSEVREYGIAWLGVASTRAEVHMPNGNENMHPPRSRIYEAISLAVAALLMALALLVPLGD
jgi:hypothetical protein